MRRHGEAKDFPQDYTAHKQENPNLNPGAHRLCLYLLHYTRLEYLAFLHYPSLCKISLTLKHCPSNPKLHSPRAEPLLTLPLVLH